MKKIINILKSFGKFFLLFISMIGIGLGFLFAVIFYLFDNKSIKKQTDKNNVDIGNIKKGNKDDKKDSNNIDNEFNQSPFNQQSGS